MLVFSELNILVGQHFSCSKKKYIQRFPTTTRSAKYLCNKPLGVLTYQQVSKIVKLNLLRQARLEETTKKLEKRLKVTHQWLLIIQPDISATNFMFYRRKLLGKLTLMSSRATKIFIVLRKITNHNNFKCMYIKNKIVKQT